MKLRLMLRRLYAKFAPRAVLRVVIDTIFVTGLPNRSLVLDDPDDDFILACAEEGRARYIVSGDHHLLDLHRHGEARILTPRDFVTSVLS